MKKISTVATRQAKNFPPQKLTVGLDLGDRWSWYCVLDEAGKIRLEQRVSTTSKAMGEVFGALPRSRMALEIGTHSPWISRLLSELGHEVIVANARKVRLIAESRKKDDRLDAQTLARLARIDPQLLYPINAVSGTRLWAFVFSLPGTVLFLRGRGYGRGAAVVQRLAQVRLCESRTTGRQTDGSTG